jgi:hypothetical protein
MKLWDVRTEAARTFDLTSMLAHSDATRNCYLWEFIGNISVLIVGGNDTTPQGLVELVISYRARSLTLGFGAVEIPDCELSDEMVTRSSLLSRIG